MSELIEVKQLPIIEEQLHQIKEEVIKQVESALTLECNEETYKEVKKERAALNNDFKAWEEKRKAVKKAVLAPYEQFEEVYKNCISEVYKSADLSLKNKIDAVELDLRDRKYKEVKAYFDEYSKSYGKLKNLTVDDANLNITLSSSVKLLKEQCERFIDNIVDDLTLIAAQRNQEEIYYHYTNRSDPDTFLNLKHSLQLVSDMHNAIDSKDSNLEAVTREPDTLTAPKEETRTAQMTFTVRGTLTQLKELKMFINEKGIEIVYE